MRTSDRSAPGIDGRVEVPGHALDEVARVLRRLEPDDVAAEHAVENRLPVRQPGHPRDVRPRNVPEHHDRGVRRPLAQEARQQRQMIVVDEDHGSPRTGLADHGVGEPAVDVLVVPPVAAGEPWRLERDMTERPERRIREAVVVAALLTATQPDAPQRVGTAVAGDLHPIARVDRGAIGGAGTMRDPRAGRGPQHRIERRHQAADRMPLDDRPVRREIVHARLTVGHHDHALAGKVPSQRALKPARAPSHGHDSPRMRASPAWTGGRRGCCRCPGRWRRATRVRADRSGTNAAALAHERMKDAEIWRMLDFGPRARERAPADGQRLEQRASDRRDRTAPGGAESISANTMAGTGDFRRCARGDDLSPETVFRGAAPETAAPRSRQGLRWTGVVDDQDGGLRRIRVDWRDLAGRGLLLHGPNGRAGTALDGHQRALHASPGPPDDGARTGPHGIGLRPRRAARSQSGHGGRIPPPAGRELPRRGRGAADLRPGRRRPRRAAAHRAAAARARRLSPDAARGAGHRQPPLAGGSARPAATAHHAEARRGHAHLGGSPGLEPQRVRAAAARHRVALPRHAAPRLADRRPGARRQRRDRARWRRSTPAGSNGASRRSGCATSRPRAISSGCRRSC